MFLGHFAAGVAAKPAAPTVPIWALFLAPQALDLAFLPLVAIGVEGFEQGDYGQDTIDALYSHSLIGAIIISAVVFLGARKFFNSNRSAWILAGLSFSHWPIDLLVHHDDLALLPGNPGDGPLLGFDLWDFPNIIIGIEIAMAVIGVAVYAAWSRAQATTRWYLGPAIIAMIFTALAVSDLARLPS